MGSRHTPDLLSTLQINNSNTQALAAGRREVTDIMESAFVSCIIDSVMLQSLRHGCLHKPFLPQNLMANIRKITSNKTAASMPSV